MTIFYSGDIVLHLSCFECVIFSSYFTFHDERLSDDLEFKSHLSCCYLDGGKCSPLLLILLDTLSTVISAVSLSLLCCTVMYDMLI